MRVFLYQELRLVSNEAPWEQQNRQLFPFRSPGYVKMIFGKEECATLPVSGARLTINRFDSYPSSIDLDLCLRFAVMLSRISISSQDYDCYSSGHLCIAVVLLHFPDNHCNPHKMPLSASSSMTALLLRLPSAIPGTRLTYRPGVFHSQHTICLRRKSHARPTKAERRPTQAIPTHC